MIPKICLFAILCTLLGTLLHGLGYKSKGLFATLGGIMLLGAINGGLSEVFGGIISIATEAGITEAAAAALRAVGLGYIFGFTSEICSSLGETLIASVVTAAGRIQIFLVAYPYIEKVVKLGGELLG
ncbi:MAG: hypothetical protein IJX58_04255 [Clostridia bacterium]|nr:hypothetical protein [Clostridia bacterium]